MRCNPTDPDVEYIKAYYGLNTLPTSQLITQDQQTMSRVFYINSELSRFLHADIKHEINIISLGVTAI